MGLKNAFSTRKAMQNTPSTDFFHELSSEELKQLQGCFLEILKDIIAVCEKHDICYMAAGGTALGSVRHKGFIPWDDDVDIIMPREDLNRFVKLFNEAMGDNYELTTPDSKSHPIESMITIVHKKNTYKASMQSFDTSLPKGISIDIFAIESVPRNPVARRIKGLCAMAIQYIAVSSLYRHYMSPRKKEFICQTKAGKFNYRIRTTIGFLFSFVKYDKWGRFFDRFVRCKKDTGLWGVPTDIGHYFGHIMPKEVYFPPVKGEFEDIMINLPHDTDAYLKNQYGDYMTIPPEADREKHWSIGFNLNSDTFEQENKS